MAFQIKDFVSITASALNWMKSATTKVTDFNVGSIVRTMIEAVAAEIDELYQQYFIGLREAIPVSVYNSFDFEAIEAASANGLVRVTVSSGTAILIPSGAQFSVAGKSVTYTNASDVTIPAGATYVDVQVAASTQGSVGNLAAGQTFTVSPTPDRFVSATNTAAFVSGQDAETPDERKIRFNAFIASLNRGTVAAIEYGLKTVTRIDSAGNIIERVATTSIVEPWLTDSAQPVGLVNCYIHNGVGSTSAALLLRARQVIYGYYDDQGNAVPGWKAAGAKVEIYAATESSQNVTATVTIEAGYAQADVIAEVKNAITNYLLELPIGSTAIWAEIIAIAMSVEGVSNFVMTVPASDVTALASVKILPGTLNITV